MARRFQDLIEAMPEARQRSIRQRTGELLADLPLQDIGRSCELTREKMAGRRGMAGSAPGTGERIVGVRFTDDTLSADLSDGRTITVPIAWYPRLLHARPAERANWRISGGGYGIHWPDIDEDVSSDGLLRGAAAPGTRRQAPSPSGRSIRYAVVIERSRTGFAAWVPDLPGCVAAAETQEELRRMIKEAIEFHIEALEESDQPVPEPSTGVEYVDVSATR